MFIELGNFLCRTKLPHKISQDLYQSIYSFINHMGECQWQQQHLTTLMCHQDIEKKREREEGGGVVNHLPICWLSLKLQATAYC